MTTLAQLETALTKAHNAGDQDSARKLAIVVRRRRAELEATPEFEGRDSHIPWLEPPKQETTLGQEAIGALETGATLATGATTGTLGFIAGTLNQLVNQIMQGNFGTPQAAQEIAQSAMSGAEAGTYTPKSETGQRNIETVSEIAEPLAAVAPMTAELQAMTSLPGRTIASQAASKLPSKQQVIDTVNPVIETAKQTAEKLKPTQQLLQDRSVGAAEVQQGTIRQAKAAELPIPIKLTEGQKTRSFEQQRFEKETAKQAEIGAPLRERFDEQNAQLQQNMDALVDATGAQQTTLRGIGESVDQVLTARSDKDLAKIRTMYKAAEKAGEMEDPVDISRLINAVNESRSAESTAPIVKATRAELIRLGMVVEDDAGNLIPVNTTAGSRQKTNFLNKFEDELAEATSKDEAMEIYNDYRDRYKQEFDDSGFDLVRISENKGKDGPAFSVVSDESNQPVRGAKLKDIEQVRQFINQASAIEGPDTKFAGDFKRAIDASTEGKGGDLYKRARSARRKYAKDYENAGLVKQLLNTKRGTDDRAIAMEDVLRKVILDPNTSLDQMRHVKRLLQTKTGGPEGPGAQAWKELQGGTLRHIQEQMTKNVQRDSKGNPVVSAAALDKTITQLDKNGKLDYIFGKNGADQLRLINDVAKDVLTSPPGTINHSNTATVLAGLMDVAISGTTGIPAPVMTGANAIFRTVKDAKLKARVRAALGENNAK